MTENKQDRYSRQILLPELGREGQEKLSRASAVVIGVGGLGSVISQTLVRAGVGFVRVVDRDVLEWSNLHRQLLYEEEDVRQGLPKAEAAARKLAKMNSDVKVEARQVSVGRDSVEELISDVSVVLDGTDNIESRFVLNDACVKHDKPWVYGGAVGTTGLVMTIVPGRGPCLSCLMESPPPAGSVPNCSTVGVLAPAPIVVAALQATEAIKLLIGDESGAGRLLQCDMWKGRFTRMEVPRRKDCPVCNKG
ncbi:MAG: HesA/MoeB/ThiF family protein [Deltaproteobacteria bacterium]|nr:HesA/MoeB/ThiF family protein [Deltaproteobacteria bacterium]